MTFNDYIYMFDDSYLRHGVKSLNSKRFQETFEDVYCGMPKLPFWVLAGNHDHRGNVSAQLEYSTRSEHWNFPKMYYNLSTPELELLMVDTVLLAGITDDSCLGCLLDGPDEPDLAEAQWDWLEQKLRQSRAEFLWVAGHYPIYSAGSDGTQALLVQRLLPMLRRYGAHYISGHDHMLEHIEVDGVHMFVTGMGRECCYDTEKLHTVPPGALRYVLSGPQGQGPGVGPRPQRNVSGGFSSIEFGEAAVVTYHDQHGGILYSTSVARRQLAVVL